MTTIAGAEIVVKTYIHEDEYLKYLSREYKQRRQLSKDVRSRKKIAPASMRDRCDQLGKPYTGNAV